MNTKFLTKILAIAGAVIIGGFSSITSYAVDYTTYQPGEGPHRYAYPYITIATDYGYTTSCKVYTLEVIEAKWGTKAKELFLEGMKTGDYFDFRAYIGNYSSNLWSIITPLYDRSRTYEDDVVLGRELYVFSFLGPYATATDYEEALAPYGFTKDTVWTRDGMNEAAKLPNDTFVHPTKQDYIAKHRSGRSADASSVANSSEIEALKNYAGNSAEFNAYNYYTRYADLQTALGANGDALLNHWNTSGKAEGRIGN